MGKLKVEGREWVPPVGRQEGPGQVALASPFSISQERMATAVSPMISLGGECEEESLLQRS
jgi:hypothetical protein